MRMQRFSTTPGTDGRAIGRFRGRGILTFLILFGSAGFPLRAFAQGAAGVEPASEAALAARQQVIQDRYQRLESRMLQLAQLLAESEPDKAARLRDAIDRAGQQRIKMRIDQIMRTLRTGQYSDAERDQQKLVRDLEAILELLASTDSDLDQRRAERQRLETLKRAVRALLDQQTDELQRTQQAEPALAAAAAIEQIVQRLERIASRQAALRTAGGVPSAGEEQESLARETSDLGDELRKGADTAADAGQREAMQAAAEQTQRASERMRQALRDSGDSAAAARSQRESEEQLKRAIQRLREQQERTEQAGGLREVERSQRDLQRRTADLRREMEPKSDRQRVAPGAPNVQNAAERMQRAADRIGEREPAEAQQEQVGAMSDLQEALDELEDSLRQLRREELEDTLAALEARFRKILHAEIAVRDALIPLGEKLRADWTRADELSLARVAVTHGEAATEAQVTLRLLTDEGTTIILPELLRQLTEQMAVLSERLNQGDISGDTRRALDDIIGMLEEILGAIEERRQQQNQSDDGQPSGQPGGSDSQPLLRLSAELRLLRSAQVRVNEQTRGLTPSEGESPTADLKQTLDRLGVRQRELSELARRLYERRE